MTLTIGRRGSGKCTTTIEKRNYREKLLVDLYEFCEGEHACRQITEIITQTFDINGILTLLREHDAVSTGK